MSIPKTFNAFRIRSERHGHHQAGVEHVSLDDLSPGEVTIKVAYSSVNYKDALAGTGRASIIRRFPLIGGLDVAGRVVTSSDPAFKEGDAVICTGCGLTEDRDGGYAEYARLQSASTIALPQGLTLRESMILGTAGFTAALSLLRMEANGQRTENGPVVITGATGGVGMLAIDVLTRAGYEVHAITSKFDHLDDLLALGAAQVIDRHGLHWGQRPLERATWAGAIDTVGDEMLAGLTRHIAPYGNIASCGMASGTALATTVMPFILRGVSLIGVAASGAPKTYREAVWQHLAGPWKPAHLDRIQTQSIGLEGLATVFATMLGGGAFGRTLVEIDASLDI